MEVELTAAQTTPILGVLPNGWSVTFLNHVVASLDLRMAGTDVCWVHVWALVGYQQLNLSPLL